MEGQVVSALTVSPASLFLGVLKPGETVKKRLVVRGSKPFRILGVKCDDARFAFEKPVADSKPLHFVPVEFKAGDKPGQIEKKIAIETDLGQGGTAAVSGQRHDQAVGWGTGLCQKPGFFRKAGLLVCAFPWEIHPRRLNPAKPLLTRHGGPDT